MARQYIPNKTYEVLGGLIYLVDKEDGNVNVANQKIPAQELYGLVGKRAFTLRDTSDRSILLEFGKDEPIRFKRPSKEDL